jgi:cyclopropane fatty-acyl-phospholipid synthase-like methyltransferase
LTDARRSSPSTARNREPILAVLKRVLGERARVLEIASGAGEHAVFFARALPHLRWQPSDPDAASRESIAAWTAHEGLANVAPPLAIDVCAADWKADGAFDAVVAINMIHIAPWAATAGLFAGAARVLGPGGVVFLYGPYRRQGEHTAPSNEAFEAWLKAQDPAFGVRDLGAVEDEAKKHGLVLREIAEMPANNLSLIFAF